MSIRTYGSLMALSLVFVLTASGCARKKELKKEEKKSTGESLEAKVEKPAEKAPSPQQLVHKAIKAAGGIEKLKTKTEAMTIHVKGTFYGAPFTSVTYWKAPDRSVMYLFGGSMVMAAVGNECWKKYNDLVIDCSPPEKRHMSEILLTSRIMCLHALEEPGVKLEPAGMETVDGKEAWGVKVTLKGASIPVIVFFDKISGQMVKMSYHGLWAGRPSRMEMILSGIKDLDGLKVATESKMKANGRVVMTEKTEKIEYQVDEAKFAKPAQAVPGVPRIRFMPPMTVAYTVHKGPYPGIGKAMGGLISWIGRKGLDVMGSPAFLYHKDPSNAKSPAEYVTEIQYPVASPLADVAGNEGFGVKKSNGTEIAVQVAMGPYEKAGEGYKKLAAWISRQGYVITGPASMATYSDPTKTAPDKLMSEIFFPVVKKGAVPSVKENAKGKGSRTEGPGRKPTGKTGRKGT